MKYERNIKSTEVYMKLLWKYTTNERECRKKFKADIIYKVRTTENGSGRRRNEIKT